MNKITDYRKYADENQSKFATAFRDIFKIAPAEYRKQNSSDGGLP